MNISILKENPLSYSTPLLVFGLSKENIETLKKEKSDELSRFLAPLLSDFKGKKNEVLIHHFPESKSYKRICLLGLGEEKKITPEIMRNAYAAVVFSARKLSITHYTIALDHLTPLSLSSSAIAEGTILADYDFDKYKTKDKDTLPHIEHVALLTSNEKNISPIKKTVQEIQLICSQVIFVRDCVNENADIMTPLFLEKLSREAAKQYGLKITVLEEKQMCKLGMNLILGVAQGSRYPPRMIFLEYLGNPKKKETLALVGKGITFDTGGLNLKPTRFIETMKCDMAGAATVLGTLKAAAALKLPVNLIGVLSCAENALGSKAQKPGDVVRAYNGVTVEITNTDAEGRLVLGDALAYLVKNQKPNKIIDIATLTGSCTMTFGGVVAGLMGTQEAFNKELFHAGESSGERLWELPIYEDYEEMLKSDIADIASCVVTQFAGTITAALFLKKFTGETLWAHLDIAGTAYLEKAKNNYIPKGATGYGVRLLIEYLKK